MKISKNGGIGRGCVALIALLSGGCSMEVSEEPRLDDVGQVQQNVMDPWGPSTLNPLAIVGMGLARGNNWYYTWYTRPGDNRLWLCKGSTAVNLCNQFDAPTDTTNASSVSAVGIHPSNSHVVYWWNSSQYTVGTSTNAIHYQTARTFTRPRLPPEYGGAVFAMTDLLDADISINGKYYYYWRGPSGLTFQTIGTASVADAHGAAIRAFTAGTIVGNAFSNNNNPAPLHTFYSNNQRNISNSSIFINN